MRAVVSGECSHVDDRKSARAAIPGSPPVGRMQGTTYGRTAGPIVTTKEDGGSVSRQGQTSRQSTRRGKARGQDARTPGRQKSRPIEAGELM